MNISGLHVLILLSTLVLHISDSLSSHSKLNKKINTIRGFRPAIDDESGIKNNITIGSSTPCTAVEETSWCPTWHFCSSSGQWTCGVSLDQQVKCENNGTISVLDCYCVTFDKNKSRSELGHCIFNCDNTEPDNTDTVYHRIPSSVSDQNNTVCGKFNREGTLCGSCIPGYYPLAYSYNLTCVRCEDDGYNWLRYIVMAFLPLTVFYFIVLLFQISVLHSHLDGFVLFSQAVTFPAISRVLVLEYYKNPFVYTSFKILTFLYGLWNLDCFRMFCDGICLRSSILLVNSLDLAVGLYPLFLIFMTYTCITSYDNGFRPVALIMKPIVTFFHLFKVKFEIRTSFVDAFSTFFLLSSVKLLGVGFDLLAPVKVHFLSISGEYDWTFRPFLDATSPYLGQNHLPYAALCFIIIVLFVFLPGLILALYPLRAFQRCLNKLPLPLLLFMHTYVDTFYGTYKDGTEPGSRDCRWFASLFFFVRISLFIAYGYTLSMMFFIFGSMVLLVLCILFIVVQPFKKDSRHNFLTLCMLCLSGLYLSILGTDIAGEKSWGFIHIFQLFLLVFSTAPLICAIYLAFYWIINRRYIQELKQWLRASCRREYSMLHNLTLR